MLENGSTQRFDCQLGSRLELQTKSVTIASLARESDSHCHSSVIMDVMLNTKLLLLLQGVLLSLLVGQVFSCNLRGVIATDRGTYRQADGNELESSTTTSNGDIMVYNGVDKSRNGHSASESNVTAYVQFLGDTSNSSSTANLSNSGDYRMVNTSLSDMTGEVAFADYTSDERTTLVSR